MANVAKSGTPSLSTVTTQVNSISGLLAGEAIAAADACYIKSDGKIWKSDGSSADAAASIVGYACQAASVGEAVTLAWDVRFRYGAGLTPGAAVYLSTDAGLIADAASTGGVNPCGVVVDATRIHLWRNMFPNLSGFSLLAHTHAT